MTRGEAQGKIAIASEGTMDEARILIANAGVQNLAKMLQVFAKTGAELVTVDNGEMACDIVLAAEESGRSFDLIIMDTEIPIRNACESASSLRQGDYSGRMIAQRAEGAPEIDQDLFDAVLSEPYSDADLLKLAQSKLWGPCENGNYFDGALTLYPEGGFGYGNFIAVENHRFVAKIESLTIMRRGNAYSPLIVDAPGGAQHHFRYRRGTWWTR